LGIKVFPNVARECARGGLNDDRTSGHSHPAAARVNTSGEKITTTIYRSWGRINPNSPGDLCPQMAAGEDLITRLFGMDGRPDNLMRTATALSLCACMMLGTIALGSDGASAQTDDAVFTGTVTIAGYGVAPDTLVMYSMDGQDTPSGNSTVTDSSGQYEIWVEGGHDYALYFANGLAMFDAGATYERTIYPGETIVVDPTLNLAPARSSTISGTVYNASNPSEPVTTGHVLGLHFSAMGPDAGPDYINWTTTDGAGYYELGILDGMVGIAVFDAEGYFPGMSETTMVLSGATATIDLGLYDLTYADTTVSGVVTDYDGGAPIEGAVVEAYLEGTPMSFRDTTEADGTYLISMMSGEGNAEAFADGYVPQRLYDVYFSGDMTVDWTLVQNNALIYGHVLDAVTMEPIEDAYVQASTPIDGRQMFNETTTDGDGYFEMDVCDGTWSVSARASGYSGNWTMATVAASGQEYVEVLLEPMSSVVKGVVKDGSSAMPIAGVTVVLQDEYENRVVSGTNVSGYYEIECGSGDYQMIFSAHGYMVELQQDFDTEVGFEDVVWLNHTMDAATTRLYGDVLDASTLVPLNGVEVTTGSISPYNPEFIRMAFTTSTGGVYSAMVVPATGQIISASLEGYDEYFSILEVPDVENFEYDIYMMPEGGVGTTYTIEGYVNASMSDTPIPGARVAAIIGLWTTLSETYTDGTGFYSFEVPTVVFTLRVSATGYLMEDLLMMPPPAETIVRQDFGLVAHTDRPLIDVTVDPDENVSTANHADIYADITEDYLYAVNLEMLRTIEVVDDTARMERLESFGFTPSMPWSDLSGSEIEPGLWQIGIWDWPATAHESVQMMKDSTAQGFFVDSDNDYYWIDEWDGTIHVEGWYENTTLGTWMYATAVFYLDGTLAGIDFGGGIDESAAGDLTGRFWLESLVYDVNLVTLTIEDVNWEVVQKVVTSSMYLDLEPPPIYPDGDCAAYFSAVDYASLWNSTITLFTVDNSPPTADAGGDQTAIVNTVVTLNASMSWDNVGIVEYKWTFEDGGQQTELGEVVDYEFTTVGDHEVTLTVTDGALLNATDSLLVQVSEDQPPVADAGEDQEVNEDVEVTLDGSGSSDDLGVADWEWTFDDGGTQTLSGEFATWTFDTPGTYTVTLVVTDTVGQTSEPDTTVITVADLTAPTADAGPDQDVVAGDEVTFDGSDSSDNSGTIANWTWTFEEDGDTLVLYGVSPVRIFSVEGTYPVTLTVKDAAGNSDTDEVVIRVASANEPPVADAGEDAEIEKGETHTFDGTGSSDDGGLADLNFTWTFVYDGKEEKLYGAEPEFTFEITGEYSVNLTVRDEEGLTDSDTVIVTVEEAGVSMMLWAAIGAVVVVAVLLAAYMVMRRGKGPTPSGGEAPEEELEEPGPPDDEEL
jgi:PKD repeat protein